MRMPFCVDDVLVSGVATTRSWPGKAWAMLARGLVEGFVIERGERDEQRGSGSGASVGGVGRDLGCGHLVSLVLLQTTWSVRD